MSGTNSPRPGCEPDEGGDLEGGLAYGEGQEGHGHRRHGPQVVRLEREHEQQSGDGAEHHPPERAAQPIHGVTVDG